MKKIFRSTALTKKDLFFIFLVYAVFILLFNHSTSDIESLNNDQALIMEGSFFVGFTLFLLLIEKRRIAKRRRMAHEQICPAIYIIQENLRSFSKDQKTSNIESNNSDTAEVINIIQNAHRLDQVVQTFSDAIDEELIRRINYLAVSLTSIERQSQLTSFSVNGLLRGTQYIRKRLEELNVDFSFYMRKYHEFISAVNEQKL